MKTSTISRRTIKMQSFTVNGAEIEYDSHGSGEPVFFIHGAIFADAFSPLLTNTRLSAGYRLVTYHRRGFAGSTRASAPFVIADQVNDARALLRHLNIQCAHIVGHSSGAIIALQWALDAPQEIRSLALLEPPLLAAVPSGATFADAVGEIHKNLYAQGNYVGAAVAFSTAVVGPEFR
jgi:pimeloyl-ACP methyl ester carboxylesterase